VYFFNASRWPSASCCRRRAAAHGLDRGLERLAIHARSRSSRRLALVVGGGEQEELRGDELVARFVVPCRELKRLLSRARP